MSKTTLKKFFISVRYVIIINLIFALILYSFVTDDDLNNLPKRPEDRFFSWDRFISLFYFLITTFTTTGYGDIYAKSNRMKLLISCYMIFVFSLTVSFLFNF